MRIRPQRFWHLLFYAFFFLTSLCLFIYYLSNTIIHFTTDQQFPISSLVRYPLSIPIFLAETFSFFFALYFIYSLMSDRFRPKEPAPLEERPPVAFCIPVYHEPQEIVERTILACKKADWPEKRIYLLDDSKDRASVHEMARLASKHDVTLVRREGRQGYKAGNVNNGIARAVTEEYFVILDSDQAPLPRFLEATMPYFADPSVFFVQTPQYYINDDTPIRRAAKIGTNVFYQAQCVAKAKDGALPFCGTNVVVRTQMFRELGGFSYYTSTEDIELGLRANARGWRGAYVPEVLVHGYAPVDWRAYSSQQYRWANGNLAILRESWKRLLWGRYSLRHQIHTFFTVSWWFIGLVTLTYILIPLIAILTGLTTHHLWLPNVLIGLLYVNVVCGIFLIFVALHGRTKDHLTLGDAFLQYSLIVNSLFIYTGAAANAMLRRYIGFVRTQKKETKVGLRDVWPNLALAACCFAVSLFALARVALSSTVEQVRTYLPASLWLLFYTVILSSSVIFIEQPARRGAQ